MRRWIIRVGISLVVAVAVFWVGFAVGGHKPRQHLEALREFNAEIERIQEERRDRNNKIIDDYNAWLREKIELDKERPTPSHDTDVWMRFVAVTDHLARNRDRAKEAEVKLRAEIQRMEDQMEAARRLYGD